MFNQEELLKAGLIFFLPGFVMFFMERGILYYLRQTPARIEWVRSQKWLHPNNISRARYVMGLVSVILYVWVSKEFALLWFSFWMISDVSDGTIAKYFDLDTERGKIIDPLSDKLFYFPPLFYAVYLDYIAIFPVIIFLVIDFSGQFMRKFIKEKGANLFGKTKTLLAVLTLLYIYVQDTFFSVPYSELTNVLIGGTIFLAVCSIFFKLIPNYWYANILSILNLSCGVAAIILILMSYNPLFAIILIYIGQFLDLFDGRAAEKWGSTPRGEIFDDLADGTSFGAAVGVLIASNLGFGLDGIAFGLIYFVSASYRLIRFIKDKKTANTDKGVSVFNGMPTPAAALLTCSCVLFISNYNFSFGSISPEIFIYAVTGIASLLMVSHAPYIHFGRVILNRISIKIQVFFYGFAVAVVGYNINKPESMILINITMVLSVLYTLIGIRYPFMKLRLRK